MILSIDVNYATHGTINYKDIKDILDDNNSVNPKSGIERNNQTLGAISLQLRKNYYESNSKRIRFNRGEKKGIPNAIQ